MHPAGSLILFTTLSGLGFGLLAFLGAGSPAVTGGVAFAFYAIAFALAGVGFWPRSFTSVIRSGRSRPLASGGRPGCRGRRGWRWRRWGFRGFMLCS